MLGLIEIRDNLTDENIYLQKNNVIGYIFLNMHNDINFKLMTSVC
ncbi:hypothetical protein M153_2810001324 [Pseudoloma neurophilia]|uniref:Uncharacterized protein n=1 Tax=Pseudoloma neurophilia TaxID=146866 RepID=A0A0R0LYK6_9MICR|nr:hypothetical protein M153_2810001324 [Pseudoloma neurophilia]